MFKVSICSPTFSPIDHIVFDALENESDIESLSRRVNRTPTLDGECVITDGGFSHSDRTIKISAFLNPAQLCIMRRLAKGRHGSVIITLPDGTYTGVIE